MSKLTLDLFNDFKDFHLSNPSVYRLFKKYAFEAINKHHRHFSADAVMHRVRWETNIETTGKEFKINNNHIAYYSRMFMIDYPNHDGFFRTKLINNDVIMWISHMLYELKQPETRQIEMFN